MAIKAVSGILRNFAWALDLCAILALSLYAWPSYAADLAEGSSQESPPDYFVCSLGLRFEPGVPTAKDLPFQHVWFGHFSGGRPFEEKDAEGRVLIDWVNQEVCFPSKPACDAWISQQRSAFHHPEGFWTCMPLR